MSHSLQCQQQNIEPQPVVADAALTPGTSLNPYAQVWTQHKADGRTLANDLHYQSLIEEIPAVTYVAGLQPGELLYLSPQAERFFGYPIEEFLKRTLLWPSLVHPEDFARAEAEDQRTRQTGEPFKIEYRVTCGDGRIIWVRDEAVLVHDAEGRPCYWSGMLLDITERKRIEEELRRSELRLAEAQRMAHLGHWEWDLVNDVVWWSDEVFRIYGYEPGSLVPDLSRMLQLVHPDDREHLVQTLDAALNQHKPYDLDHRIMLADGSVRILHRQAEVMFDAAGKAVRMIGTIYDITDRRRLEERLHYQAYHDPLTRLPNRLLFLDRLDRALERGRRTGSQSAVLYLDLDRFKLINDSLGHYVGDELLVAVAECLSTCLRATDTCARLGGDEFTILLEELSDPVAAIRTAQRICDALLSPFKIHQHELFITVSIGIAMTTTGADSATDLLRFADVAMYRAKDSGRAGYALYDPSMNAYAVRRLALETQLRRAVERGEFRVLYQPKVNLETGKIIGMEALLRWEHPEHGLISPAEFIPLAEETGLILPIGRWVLEEACRQTHTWQCRYPDVQRLMISVNLSARQFLQPGLIEEVAEVLKLTGLASGSLELEITESVVMHDAELTILTLQHLKRLGVRLAIDDFGTGYSSLSYLKRFPVDVLKIDKSFVDGLCDDSDDSAIVQAVISLGHALRLQLVAEGVETAQQSQALMELGCELGQGYYYSRPLPESAADVLLAARMAVEAVTAP